MPTGRNSRFRCGSYELQDSVPRCVVRYASILMICGFCVSQEANARPSQSRGCDTQRILKKAHATYSAPEQQFLHIQSLLTFTGQKGAETTKRFREYYQFPNRARFEYHDAKTSSVVGTDGIHSWRATNQGPAMHSREHFTVPMRMRNFAGLIQEFISADGEAECVQDLENNLQRILITLKTREMILLDIDPTTGLIHRYQGESPDTGKSDVIEVEILEWKKIQGVWIAAKFNTAVNSVVITRNEFIAARFPSTIPSVFFAPQP